MMASANATYGQKESTDQNFDYMFKILIIGNSSVGKTSFLFRYADDSFTPAFVSTVGIDFKVKTIYRNDKRIKLQIWDTAGQERYRTITTAYYRGAMGFILMYDITNEESFNAVQDWSTQIKTYSWDNAQVLLVGNKCDMEDERVVAAERGRQLSEQLGKSFGQNENWTLCVVLHHSGCVSPVSRNICVYSDGQVLIRLFVCEFVVMGANLMLNICLMSSSALLHCIVSFVRETDVWRTLKLQRNVIV
uniref:small monomeric GTPase n=1 Tax=Haplochromis burtoni TaxID=8153 RepID=A0A3Q2WSQ6_HAPBU